MKFIYLPLIILIVISMFVQVYSFSSIQDEYETDFNINHENITIPSFDDGFSIAMTVSLVTGMLAFFVTIAILGIIIGLDIEVLGSTIKLSERSQNLIYNGLFYGGLWGIFSVLATVGITGVTEVGIFSIPVVGALTYFGLTLFYIFGINQQIHSTN